MSTTQGLILTFLTRIVRLIAGQVTSAGVDVALSVSSQVCLRTPHPSATPLPLHHAPLTTPPELTPSVCGYIIMRVVTCILPPEVVCLFSEVEFV